MTTTSKLTTIFFIGAIIIIVGLLWGAYFYFTLSPVVSEASAEASAALDNPVLIKKGDGLKKIAAQLEEAKLIRSASSFEFYSFLTGAAHRLKPGLYNISPASSTAEIIRLLVAGPSKEIQVLIREGETLADIDSRLSRLGIIKAGDFINFKIEKVRGQYPFLLGASSLEGYLFPDTYRFFFDSAPEAAVRPFLENFKAKADPLIANGEMVDYDSIPITRRGIYSLHEIITLASMLEKEVPDSQERKLAADILYRRLRLRMPLQVDATTDYATSHGEQYDTYKIVGLPPRPIANPGLDAISAALNPKPNQYLYYLSDPKTNKTIFAKTFEEHKTNKEKYLR